MRIIVRNTDSITTTKDYEPFGEERGNDFARTGFIGKEKDNENLLSDFGVRKYDEKLGRFLQTEPLIDDYLSWSSYQYAGNNPISIYDYDGTKIRTASSGIQNNISMLVPEKFRQYVKFNDDGTLNNDLLQSADTKGLDVNSNMRVLQRMSANPLTVELIESEEMDFIQNKRYPSDETFDRSLIGLGAITLPPNYFKDPLSPNYLDVLTSKNGNINIYIRPNFNTSKNVGHELFLHARIMMQGGNYKHNKTVINNFEYELNPLIDYYENIFLDWYNTK